ncbi:30S ribosomal protein S4e [Candidatus Woesearchaeota archaeon]|nr:30S ribosomal protein S4e [Candidatus Woesearchaeota archaeon]
MAKNHIKRVNAPKRWDVLRKNKTFITRPNPGRDISLSISLNSALKEMLGKAKTTKESKFMIKTQEVLVNGKRRFDEKFPVGFLDVISFPSIKEHYRLLVNQKDKLFLDKISEEESKVKLSKVINLVHLPRGIVQLNCSDGKNFLFKKDDPLLKQIKRNDSLLYSIPGNQIKKHLKMEKGALVYLYKGKHVGNLVKIDDLDPAEPNIVFKLDDDVFETRRIYAFVVGQDKPVISLSIRQSAPGNNDGRKPNP